MSIILRVARLLGKDTTAIETRTEELKEYEVSHIDGDTTTVYAHGYFTEGSLLKFWRYDDIDTTTWGRSNSTKVKKYFGGIALNKIGVKNLNSIKELKVTNTINQDFTVEYDRADLKLINFEKEKILE